MITNFKPLVSLAEWAQIVGVNPWVLAQVNQPSDKVLAVDAQCGDVFYDSPYQTAEQLTRGDIAEALIDAEQLISNFLGYDVAPKEHHENAPFPRSADRRFRQAWVGASGRRKSIKTNLKKIIGVGQYTETAIETIVSLSTSDPYSDGFNTRFSLSVTVEAGTLASELAVYLSEADRVTLPRNKTEIYPLDISISGTTATIEGWMYQVVKPENYFTITPAGLSADDAIFATTLDVYRRQIDVSLGGNLIWDGVYYGEDCDETPCDVAISSACFTAIDAERGYVAPIPATYNESAETFSRYYPNQSNAPDRVQVYYVAGIPRDSANGRVEHDLGRATALLATALLPNRKCGCDQADLRISYYKNMPLDDEKTLMLPQAMVERAGMLFGATGRGAIRAFMLLNKLKVHT